MTPTLRDLHELFDDMSAAAPDNRGRITQLERRIRRDTRHRATGTALAAAAVVAAATMFVPTVLSPGPTPPHRETTAAVEPPAGLPMQFTSNDGSAYHRLAFATLTKEAKKASLTVPVSGKPLEVAALCPKDNPTRFAGPGVLVNGKPSSSWFQQCLTGERMALEAVNVPKSADHVTITFDTANEPCARKQIEPCQPADWPVAVYEYTPPAQPVEPASIEDFPRTLGTLKLAGQASGVWPRTSSFKLTVTSPGGYFRVEHRCTGDLAGRLTITYRIGDEASQGAWICTRGRPTETNAMLWSRKVPEGATITVSGKVKVQAGHPNRQARWSVAVYSSKIVKLAH
ncbi:hypothetical protein AB0K12_32665 [Nonomuraea sp. NPDC049419]|uniref:hypothetical protein n=1 Tax=Nonomuraea sp. NPDC049419 TaxID=3155772 RepID=UPI00343D3282